MILGVDTIVTLAVDVKFKQEYVGLIDKSSTTVITGLGLSLATVVVGIELVVPYSFHLIGDVDINVYSNSLSNCKALLYNSDELIEVSVSLSVTLLNTHL
jgi:hypothetical protein